MVKFKGILFSFILAFGIVASRSIPCLASAYVIDPSTIGSIGDLGLGLLGGAEFNFTGSKYQIENYDSLSQADKVDAAIGATNQFIEDYWSARKEYIKANNGFLQETYKVYDNYALKNAGLLNTDTDFHISGQLATDWMQYSRYWYKDYISSFDLTDVITPNAPIDYSYLSNMNYIYVSNGNGSSHRLLDNNSSYKDYWNGTLTTNTVYNSSYYATNAMLHVPTGTQSTIRLVKLSDIYSIYINGSGSTYTITYPNITISTFNGVFNCIGTPSVQSRYDSAKLVYYYYINGNPGIQATNDTPTITLTSNFNSLQSAVDFVYNHFAYVNLYVNDELWAMAGAVIDPDLTPDFPDVIGTDDDPIYTFDLPDTSNYEGAFDITSLFDAIKEAIIGASDTDNTTSGVLTGENVSDLVVDDTGTLVGTKAVPISTVLDDSIEGEATKRLPNIDLYPDQIHNAFSGTTLLADIVLATQQSLPSQLIIVFWGIVIVLFLIALIKSLHR